MTSVTLRSLTPDRPSRYLTASPVTIVLWSLLLSDTARAAPSSIEHRDESSTVPPPSEQGKNLLPAQIGGIVGSYAASLVLVALLLLLLSKRRREHLETGELEASLAKRPERPAVATNTVPLSIKSPRSIPRTPISLQNPYEFSPISPASSRSHHHSLFSNGGRSVHPSYDPNIHHSSTHLAGPPTPAPYIPPASPLSGSRSPLGIDESVDQRVVAADRVMAQSHVELMYKLAFEQEERKKQGLPLEDPLVSAGLAPGGRVSSSTSNSSQPGVSDPESVSRLKKEKTKPANLNLGGGQLAEKHQSRTSSLFSALRSPRKKGVKGVSISSPIMTPMSGTFPRESREMNTIPPRQYAPASPPPIPMDQLPFRASKASVTMPLTPDYSPDAQSIDERLGAKVAFAPGHSRSGSSVPTEADPNSAVSESSQAPLIGLPQSPKPGSNRFPSLPLSPKPGSTFSSGPASPRGVTFAALPLSPKPGSSFGRQMPSAVRTGGALPLRAYEPSLMSPTMSSQMTKQTVFERLGPLSPGAQTPYTGMAVPYTPYQPFSPCIPVTPSLITREDRKRMRRLEPKTPTVEMVKSSEEVW